MNKSWDCLKILTKSQIIDFLKQNNWLHTPSEREIKVFKWEIESKALEKEMDEHMNNRPPSHLSKKVDELADKFNKETSSVLRLKIIREREEIIKLFEAHQKEWDVINKKQNKNYKYYESIEDL